MNDIAPQSPDPTGRARILLVDDDPIMLDSLGGFLRLEGYATRTAESVPEALDILAQQRINLVITDVTMPGSDGFALLEHVRREQPDVVVIMVTGYGSIESAVQAMKQGAYEYLTKPIIDDDVRLAVRRALDQQQLIAENRQLRQALAQRDALPDIIGQDYRMRKVFELVDAVADTRSTVLVSGESGTGKSVVGRAIHAHSSRKERNFVEVSCGALPETLLASELFGHVRGAFTHAVSDKEGKLAAADGGTLFLDEIDAASPQLQVKLLRALQNRTFEPVGSNATRTVDVRIILATNRDLKAEVAAGRFRQDLYYRINVVNIELPPLRQRLSDIPLLAGHFLAKFAAESGRQVDRFTPQALQAMQRYNWPGNVRELENCVERAVVLCRSDRIDVEDLPPAVLGRSDQPAGSGPLYRPGQTLSQALLGPEKRIIAAALEANDGSRQATADELGINRTTLYKKMRKFDLLD